VWDATPGDEPKDNPLSLPVLEWRDGRRVLYCTTGCGALVCLDARTGERLWRYQMSIGGLNSSVVRHQGNVIAIHGRENLDSSTAGRMVAVAPGSGDLEASAEVWRNELSAFSSSPVLLGDRIYQTVETGELACVNADTGEVLWRHRLAAEQVHASPAAGDGKLYVPMNNGTFHIVRPSDEGPSVLGEVQLEGNCLGAPAICGGRVYLHTTEKLYCFGTRNPSAAPPAPPWAPPARGAVSRLQIVPCELILRPGERATLRPRGLDRSGQVVEEAARGVSWQVESGLGVTVDASGAIAAGDRGGAGTITATLGDMKATARVRVIPPVPFTQDFESFTLAPRRGGDGALMALPPPWWIGGRLKWEVRELDGNKVLAKTLDRALFQRVVAYIGHPAESGYTMQIDLMSEGTRRSMSSAGVINQRYMVVLKGNHQQLEISSNDERIKHSVPFDFRPGTWYRLLTRVDREADGTAIVRGKAWPRDQAEPSAWTIEFRHRHGHEKGVPGLFGFTPQSRHPLYVDNVIVGRD
jgi:hypothetical protein